MMEEDLRLARKLQRSASLVNAGLSKQNQSVLDAADVDRCDVVEICCSDAPCLTEAMQQRGLSSFSLLRPDGVGNIDAQTREKLLGWFSEKRPQKAWFSPPAIAHQNISTRCSLRSRQIFRQVFEISILELSGRVQELQNEANCMNDSKDFQDAESVRSGNSHVTSRPMSFPTHPIPEGMLRPSFVSPRRKEGPPCIWDTHGILGNVFANPHASSSAPYAQELNPWSTTIEEPLHMSTAEKSERLEQNRDLRCQSGPSAKDSVIFSGGDYSKNYGADQQRLQISDLYFYKFPTPATFACWKIRFKTEVCTCSQFPTEALQWIKEGEMVDSVDDLRSSSSTRGISMPNFEVLDARIASALNKIIHNSHFKEESVWRNKRPRSRTVSFAADRLLT